MKIRIAQRDDLTTLVAFNLAMANETEALILDKSILTQGVATVLAEPEKGHYLVAEVDQQVVASLMVTYEWSDWRAKNYYWIQSVYVQPEYRRQGIYRQLYQAVKQQAQAAGGAASFRLYVEQDNVQAQKTYQTLGMTPSDYLLYEEK